MEKLCVFCKKWEIDFDEGYAYSSWTWEPGGMYIECKPEGKRGYCGRLDFRELILKAESCPHYEPDDGK